MGFKISPNSRYIHTGKLSKFAFVEFFSSVLSYEFQDGVQPLRQDIRILFRSTPLTSAQTHRNGFLTSRIKDHVLHFWLFGFARRQTVNTSRMHPHIEFSIVCGIILSHSLDHCFVIQFHHRSNLKYYLLFVHRFSSK